MEELLERLRTINRMLQKEGGFVSAEKATPTLLPFQEMAKRLAEILGANTYLIDDAGTLLGFSEAIDINNERVKQMLVERKFPSYYTSGINQLNLTTANIGIESDITVFPVETRDIFVTGLTTVIPIFAAGKRLGSLIFARLNTAFNTGDLILAEHSATVIGMELLHLINVETEIATRAETAVHIALQSLSFSEMEAVSEIFRTIEELEARINASQIAAKKGITRSVIVNALRKLESARVLESKSLGMKGTYIKVLSPILFDELKKKLQV
ncbi:GTP-sensing pleiotropic transcriptional regulator CodY [Jeotgalibaca caeni]|uniref:GTP-sensing pleiotropic transcriptional regulator CodY n=1 Tax=Jeotgalibaca caeni TaxID=3028623 RepID=UPI00237D6BD0|nr:GTP-sensing pleiotropic transcriptional regulator CodY [Jeotgalibaca caeni]MDE1548445.1 GTP-sensing pleiotropic transcriptional regulator CodY [Jeotgalibaca caeni]